MISLPFFSGPERVYITPKLPPCELLSPAAGQVGVVLNESTTPSLDRKTRIPTGFITAKFLIHETERQFHVQADSFWIIPAKDVPKSFSAWLKADEHELENALRLAEKKESAAFKKAQKDAAAHEAHLAAIFKASREFWQAWTGPGEPPEGSTTAEPPVKK
ncbi:MAG: hypothetical protein DI585_06005 [Pseudomonas fluorescens]|nr:MAG: hypothetical protein DI585_06005 [Pseudomonas fluorescens]